VTPSPQVIRTLVIDDSAFVRKIVREMLSGSPHIEVVGAARDGEEALELVETLRPDVVTCDLVMPGLDGVGFVRKQMARRPLPILILSSAPQDADKVIEALSAGAIDLVRKPTALATDDLFAIREQLVEKVKAAAGASTRNLVDFVSSMSEAQPTAPRTSRADIVVLGISTGGPQALRRMMPLFPADFPVPIAIVLHMPVGYTALYAEKLNELCALEVREAKEGDVLRPGVVLIAPAGRHLVLSRKTDGQIVAGLTVHPLDKIHRPSVDVLFRSAADVYRDRVLAVVMTGMGDDGREGAAWVKAQGGTVLTEAEKSCIIYGMPRSVVEAGLSDAAFGLSEMARAITEQI
jgi:two-component system, chemotaxis family, protein-glutamate methylesterase/glutaminase